MNKDSSAPQNEKPFSPGKYVFTGELQETIPAESPIPVIWAEALRIQQSLETPIGDCAAFALSDLILKSSVFLEEDGRKLEAHKLYTWPRNLGSTKDWTTAKCNFLQEFILNFPIEIISVHAEQGLTWRFISPEDFKKLPPDLQPEGISFQEFMAHPETYFFLRKPKNDPK